MKILWNKEGTRAEMEECSIAVLVDYNRVEFYEFDDYYCNRKCFHLSDVSEIRQYSNLIVITFNRSQFDVNGKMIKHSSDRGCAQVNADYIDL